MAKFIDETGNKYGNLVVIKYVGGGKPTGSMWFCRCVCGKTRTVTGRALRAGDATRCGVNCSQKKRRRDAVDESGKIYGHLTVMEIDLEKTRSEVGIWWKCSCKCGGTKSVNGSTLRMGRVTSCGCKFSNKRPYGEAAFDVVFKRIRLEAQKRGYKWNLSKEDVRNITSKNCFYCGREPSQIGGNTNSNGKYVYNGIDRINNDIGYTPENVVPCCRQCNFSKGKLTKNEFFDWIKMVYKNI